MVLRAGLQAGLLNQSSAQVIDGSLKFDNDSNTYLTRTPSSAGNRNVWTWSGWVKKTNATEQFAMFTAYGSGSNSGYGMLWFQNNGVLYFHNWDGQNNSAQTDATFRDTGWYHVVAQHDESASSKMKFYVNGIEQSLAYNLTTSTGINDTIEHRIGMEVYASRKPYDGSMSQVYFIDGQALGPENFGFTDPLTNTWRPKKYTGDFNISASDYTGIFAPYSTSARFNSFKTYTNLNENATSYTLPMGNPSHYGGKVLDLASGGFQVQTNNSAAGDFFMAVWVNLDTYETSKQFGVDIANNYVYFETVSSGAVKIRHYGSGGATSSSGYANDTNQWQHWALSRSGGSLRAFVDGEQIVTDTGGISGNNTVLANSKFNFFGADNNTTSYNINGQVIDAVIYIGQGVSGNFTPPTAPLIDSSGNINHYSGFSDSQLYFASPLVDVSGSDPNGVSDYYTTGINSFYLPFDGNSPIGKDKSGNGNDWTPVNFGGSNSVDKATGALPILEGPGGAVANVATRTDANASSLVLALPLVGNVSDESNHINSGSTTKTFTTTGTTASNGFWTFYGASLSFDGSDDRLVSATSSDFTFGTGDFTIEGWVYPDTNNANKTVFSTNWGANGSFIITYSHPQSPSGTGKFALFDHTQNAGTPTVATSNTYAVNNWYHVAFVRNGTSHKFYINGVEDGSATYTASDLTRDVFVLGAVYTSGGETFDGFIQDVRIYKGLAKYTENFIPASTNPDILPDTPSGVSGGSKLTKITDGAVHFDGPTDGASVGTGYLTIPSSDSSDFNFGTGDFTWEAFVYGDDWTGGSSNQDQFVIHHEPTAGGDGSGLFVSGGQSYYYSNKASSRYIITGPVLNDKRWYHIAASRESGTLRLFVDGVSVGSASYTDTYADSVFVLGRNENNNKNQFRGFISNFRVIKGNALYTSNFTPPTAPLTNVTNTKLLCCQSPTSATAAAVSPGTITANGDAAATNFNPFNTDINTVRGQESGYCTWNPLVGTGTLSDGNLKFDGTSAWKNTDGTISFSSGKWYYEGTYVGSQYGSNQGNIAAGIGFKKTTAFLPEGANAEPVNSADYRNNTIAFYQNGYFTDFGTGTGTHTSIRSQIATGDVVGVSIDLDNGSYEFYLNGISITSGTVSYTGELVPWIEAYYVNAFVCNFGQKPFKFPPPDGFQPLNAANVRPETVISRPDKYVAVTTYAGNATTQHINVGLRPDFVWIKERTDSGGVAHYLGDTVRGINKNLKSNNTDSEGTNDIYGYVSSVDDKGFTVTQGSSDSFYTNGNPETYVAWTWKAGGNKGVFNIDDVGYASAAAAGLTAGTITPSGCSVGTKQGFSIIKYAGSGTSGDTLPHGLSQTPDFIITKNLTDGGVDWIIKPVGSLTDDSYMLIFNNNGQFQGSGGYISAQSSTTVTFTDGANDGNYNNLGDNYIMYAWHNVPGLQKFGTFYSNGTTDNAFVELGFKPKLVFWKFRDNSGGWFLYDSERATYANGNPLGKYIELNSANAEGDATPVVDFLSNGFKVRNNFGGTPQTLVYAAWAETPTFNLYGGQSNAR